MSFKITNEFYEKALLFTLNRIKFFKVRHIDKYEILHTAIINKDINESNWKQIIVKTIQDELNFKNTVAFDEVIAKASIQKDHRHCRICDNTYPSDYFISGFNYKRGKNQYRTICRMCFNSTEKRRKKQKEYRSNNKDYFRIKSKEYRDKRKRLGLKDETAMDRYKRFVEKKKNPNKNN